MTTSFEITGLESLGSLADKFKNKVQQQVDLASKTGINKTADIIAYGRESNIKPSSIKADSVVSMAAKALRIPTEHIFYRTFLQGIKVSAGKGRGAKPYASIMFRANGINIADLLYTGEAAKQLYGFQSRKRKVSGKKRGNIAGKAAAARVGGRRGGKVRVAGRVYNAFIEDGSHRVNNNEHYVSKLGAKGAPKLKGRMFVLIAKKDDGQKLPYPAKIIKLNAEKVMRALNAASTRGIRLHGDKIDTMQAKELHKKLKKLGFELK